MTLRVELDLYMVVSHDGKWLRSTGRDSYGKNHWVDNVNNAKIWSRIGPARAQITRWANMYPDYPIPQLVHLTTGVAEIIDETDRVRKSQAAAERERIAQDERREQWRRREEWEKDHAKLMRNKPKGVVV